MSYVFRGACVVLIAESCWARNSVLSIVPFGSAKGILIEERTQVVYWIWRACLNPSIGRLSLFKMRRGWYVDQLQSSVCVFMYGIRSTIYCWFISIDWPFHSSSSFGGHLGVSSSNSWRCSWCVNPLSIYLGFWVCTLGCLVVGFCFRKLRFGGCLWVVKVRILQQNCSIFQLWPSVYAESSFGMSRRQGWYLGWSDQGSDNIFGYCGILFWIWEFYRVM